MTGAANKIRIYDLARELKLDTRRVIEEIRREGVDVSLPSNHVSKELADKIRNRYLPKKEISAPRAVPVIRKAEPANRIRIDDLARELKLDTKRVIEEIRREGVDVSVPSNRISNELANKIRARYLPKEETSAPPAVRVKKLNLNLREAFASAPNAEAEPQPSAAEPEPVTTPAAEPNAIEVPPVLASPGATPGVNQPERKIGPYTLTRRLGRGAFGTVWLAEKRTAITTTRFAVKLPHEVDIELKAVQQEAALWVQASGHPNVLPIIEADVYDGQVMIVSEYAPDGSLAAWLHRHGDRAPNVETATDMALGLLAGLQHLHERQIIHRDLKPENILLQGDTPRLADFGIARLLASTSQSTQISGTLAYMAPEAFDGKRSVQTDVWSAGVICYQMLAGGLPYPQPELASLVGAIMRFDPPPLPDSVPNALREVVSQALHRDPSERFKTAAEMRQALRAAWRSSAVTPQRETAPAGPVTEPMTPVPPRQQATVPFPPARNADTEPIDMTPVIIPVPEPPGRSRALLFGLGGVGIVLVLALVSLGLVLGIYYLWPGKKGAILGGNGAPRPVSTKTPPAVTTGSWKQAYILNGEKGGPGSVTFSPDSQILACVWNYVGSPTVKLFNARSGTLIRALPANSDWVSSLHFSPDGKMLAGTADRSFRIWDVTTGSTLQTITTEGKVFATVFSPDGQLLATTGDDKGISLWDTRTWKRTRVIGEGIYAGDLAFSPDGALIASAAAIKIWDVASGTLKATLPVKENDSPEMVVFSPDGTLLASANLFNQTATVYDVASAQLLRTFSGFDYWVDSVDFTPDGKLLAIRSRAGVLKIEDVQTGAIVQTLDGVHEDRSGGSDDISFSPDGMWLASGDGSVSFLIWKRGP